MVSDIKTVPSFVLRDYWIAGNITDEEYRAENDRRYAQQKLERDALGLVKRLINIPAFATSTYGDGEPYYTIKFDDHEGMRTWLTALREARALSDASLGDPTPAPRQGGREE